MIADTFIKRPVTAIVVSIVLVLVGLLALNSLPVSQYPDITPPTVQVTSNFIGADAQTVEQTVTTPIEIQVNGTPGMAYMQSNSTNNGQSTITVTYEIGADVNTGMLDVQNRVGIATPSLPEEIKRLGVTTFAGGHICTQGYSCHNIPGQLYEYFCEGCIITCEGGRGCVQPRR